MAAFEIVDLLFSCLLMNTLHYQNYLALPGYIQLLIPINMTSGELNHAAGMTLS